MGEPAETEEVETEEVETEDETEDPDAAELAQLRQEKKDAAEAKRKADAAELEQLRKEREAAAKKVAAPKTKTQKASVKTEEVETTDDPPAKTKRRVSRWFPDDGDDD